MYEKYTYYIQINGYYLKSFDMKNLECVLTQYEKERKIFYNLEYAKMENQYLEGDIYEQYEIKTEKKI